MRKKWTIGIVIGLFFLYVSYFGLAGIGLSLWPSAQVGVHVGDSWVISYGSATYTNSVTQVSGTVINITSVIHFGISGVPDMTMQYQIDVSYPFGNIGSSGQDNQRSSVVRSGLNVGDGVVYNYQNALGPWSNVSSLASRMYFGTTRQVAVVIDVFGLTGTNTVTTYYYFDRSTGILCEMIIGSDSWLISQYTPAGSTSYTLTTSVAGSGSISPSGGSYPSGTVVNLIATPNSGSGFVSWNGVDSSNGNTATVTMSSDRIVTATFSSLYYGVAASAGAGGSITPSGTIIVNFGASQTFTITADASYYISDVLVDGNSVGTVPSYTFTNIQGPHTIFATFSASPTPVQIHLTAIYNGNPVSATLNIYFPDGHNEEKLTPYDNLNAPIGTYSVSAIYQDKVISSYQIVLGSGQNFVHTFDFGNGPIVNPDYFMLIIRALLGNSQLMQLVGFAITVPSVIMLFWPKHRPQYS